MRLRYKPESSLSRVTIIYLRRICFVLLYLAAVAVEVRGPPSARRAFCSSERGSSHLRSSTSLSFALHTCAAVTPPKLRRSSRSRFEFTVRVACGRKSSEVARGACVQCRGNFSCRRFDVCRRVEKSVRIRCRISCSRRSCVEHVNVFAVGFQSNKANRDGLHHVEAARRRTCS